MKSPLENRTLELFAELLDYPSPPGHERLIADRVAELAAESGIPVHRDGAHNITVDIEGREPDAGRMVLAAHMDELAMVVTSVEEDGKLRVTRSGGLYPAKLGEGPVDLVGSGGRVPGIYSLGSMHRKDAAERKIGWEDSWILTGLSPEALRERGVDVGTPAVPAREVRGPVILGPADDPLVAAWTFDDRAGVATLLRLLEAVKKERITPRRPTTIAFTVHEEGGCHGAKNVARRLAPEVFVAVDGSPIPPGSPLTIDGSPGVWCKDSLTTFDPGLVEAFALAAERAGTRAQRAVFDSASSDASAVYAAGFADRVATFGHVRENSHGYEVARVSVFDAVYRTLIEFLASWDG